MASYSFKNQGTSFELENGEEVVYASEIAIWRQDPKKPKGIKEMLMYYVTNMGTWCASVAITNKRIVTVLIKNALNKNKSQESFYYNDVYKVTTPKEEKKYLNEQQARFEIYKGDTYHTFYITPQATAANIAKAVLSDAREASKEAAEFMKTLSQVQRQREYDTGYRTYEEAQAAFNSDVDFWNNAYGQAKKNRHFKIGIYPTP